MPVQKLGACFLERHPASQGMTGGHRVHRWKTSTEKVDVILRVLKNAEREIARTQQFLHPGCGQSTPFTRTGIWLAGKRTPKTGGADYEARREQTRANPYPRSDELLPKNSGSPSGNLVRQFNVRFISRQM